MASHILCKIKAKPYNNTVTLSIAITSVVIWGILLLVQILTKYNTSIICQNIEFCLDITNITLITSNRICVLSLGF